MPRSRFEELAERWVPGTGPAQVQPLASGLMNESCRVTRDGRVFSLRIAAADGADLGLDRQWECAVREQAGIAGLAPPVHRCLPRSGLLVAEWAAGRTWSAAEARLPEGIDAMALLLRRVHALRIPSPPRRMDPAAWIDHYRAASSRHGTAARTDTLAARGAPHRVEAIAPRSTALRRAADARLAMLAAQPQGTAVLCHSDLHRLNLLAGGPLVLLDWEYAHVSDGFWDLAGWVANNDWSVEEATRLLACYQQRPSVPADLGRLELWTWLYDYVCLLWCELYAIRRPGVHGDEVAARADLLATRLARRPEHRMNGVLSGGRAG